MRNVSRPKRQHFLIKNFFHRDDAGRPLFRCFFGIFSLKEKKKTRKKKSFSLAHGSNGPSTVPTVAGAGLVARRSTYIFVLEEAQHLQLAEHTLRGHERLENVGQLLECDPASITRIGDSPANEKRKKKKIG